MRNLGHGTKCIVEDDIEIDILRCGRKELKELVEMMTVHFFTISRIDDAALPPLVARNQHKVNPEACREQFRKFLEHIWSSLPDSVTYCISPRNDRTNFEDILYTLAVSLRNWFYYLIKTRGYRNIIHPINEDSVDFYVEYYDGMDNVLERCFIIVPSVMTIIEEIKALLVFRAQQRMR